MTMSAKVLMAGTLTVLFMLCAGASSVAGKSDAYQPGDEWTYDMDMTIDTVVLSGTVRYYFDGEDTRSVAGYQYVTYEIRCHGSMAITGTVEGYSVSGTASIDGVDSVDQRSLDVVVSESNLSMTMSTTVLFVPMSMEFWVHNVDTYSPPGGVGDEPQSKEEGVSWTKTYNTHTETMTSEDGDITTDSSSDSETETYTYMGLKSVTVPAGEFECDVIQTNDGDSITTDWYNDRVGTYVKSVYQSGSSESGTLLLKSYSYTPPSSGTLSTAMTLIGLGVAAAAVVAVVAIWMVRNGKRKSQEMQASQVPLEPEPPIPPAG